MMSDGLGDVSQAVCSHVILGLNFYTLDVDSVLVETSSSKNVKLYFFATFIFPINLVLSVEEIRICMYTWGLTSYITGFL